MTQILLVGSDEPLLEGLAQSLAALGHTPRVATTIGEARESALVSPPLVAVVSREVATHAGADALGIQLSPGGALVLFRSVTTGTPVPLPYSLQRQVLADLTLPLERNRLVALLQHVRERAAAAGRSAIRSPDSEPEQQTTERL
jgi:hypothetical protein